MCNQSDQIQINIYTNGETQNIEITGDHASPHIIGLNKCSECGEQAKCPYLNEDFQKLENLIQELKALIDKINT